MLAPIFSPRSTRSRLAALAFLSALFWPGHEAAAAPVSEELVTESRFTVEHFIEDPEELPFKAYLDKARGVFIIPELVKGGLILGAEGGTGVLLVRGNDGEWSSPAFYTLAAGSIGLQIGGQVAEVVFTLMSDEAVAALLADEFKLGADLSVAVGPKGAGLEASTGTNLSADIYAFSKAAGLFGGGSLEGAKIFERETLNAEYYGRRAGPREIVIERRFSNPQAERLRQALTRDKP